MRKGLNFTYSSLADSDDQIYTSSQIYELNLNEKI